MAFLGYRMTEVFEFGIGNAECGIEIGKMSDFNI
jgi:hypothetical protein